MAAKDYIRLPLAMIAAIGSLALGASVLSGAVYHFGYQRALVFHETISESLSRGDLTEARTALKDFQRRIPLDDFLHIPAEARGAVTKNYIGTTLSLLLDTLTQLEDKEYAAASALYFGEAEGSLRSTYSFFPHLKATKSSLEELRQGFFTLRQSYRELEGPLADAEEKISDNIDRIAQQLMLVEDVALETSDLFSLLPETYQREDFDSNRFYEKGVLTGLPKVRAIPDDIKSLGDLKKLLDKVGGRVDIKGKNVRAQFEERIEKLRRSASVFRNRLENLLDKNRELRAELTTQQKNVEQYSEVVTRSLRFHLNALSDFTKLMPASPLAPLFDMLPEEMMGPLARFLYL